MNKILLITPPFVQPNAPYPATAYLKGYLSRHGVDASQCDLSVELLGEVFSSGFLCEMFEASDLKIVKKDSNLARIYSLRERYISTIDCVISFLRGGDGALANLICTPEFIAQASRFESATDLDEAFGSMGTNDCAKYICTLYLQDLSDFIRATVSEHFEIVKYAEKISISISEFNQIEQELAAPLNIIELRMVRLLTEKIDALKPDFVGITVPFPGNLFSALRCAQYIKAHYPAIKTIIGGGYPSTELRTMSDKGIFNYFDYVSLDDGELALERIVTGGELIRTYTIDGYIQGSGKVSHTERGCPDFGGLPLAKYFSLLEVTNPMHRLWSDGRWNKMMIAHGCYWAKCAFCDTSLDYIGCYDTVSASEFVDWMERVSAQTHSRGFHFVDEAAPPKLLKEISLEILRRKIRFSWWTNIRFESAYTGDLCQLMAAAGCIAVSGGLEVASDRLLELINKGITIEQATISMRNFYYAGIMVHSYLMYGLPTQTLQESVDSLEIVRQMFQAELINSAFWHRYAMTIHSPSGISPETYGVKRRNTHPNAFANNEVYFAENRGYNINIVGDALHTSLANYMVGSGVERPAHKWFECKAQPTTIEPSVITDHIIKPDNSRIFNENARLVWIGSDVERTKDGIAINSASGQKSLKFEDADADFLVRIMCVASNLNEKITFAAAKTIYAEFSAESFSVLYHSKKWDVLRGYGLLQI